MVAGGVLVLLVLVAGTSDRTGRLGALALLALAVVWVRVNQPMEGKILIVLEVGHGLTAADLVSVAAGLIAVWRLVERRPT